jgi:hypothetical protein
MSQRAPFKASTNQNKGKFQPYQQKEQQQNTASSGNDSLSFLSKNFGINSSAIGISSDRPQLTKEQRQEWYRNLAPEQQWAYASSKSLDSLEQLIREQNSLIRIQIDSENKWREGVMTILVYLARKKDSEQSNQELNMEQEEQSQTQ